MNVFHNVLFLLRSTKLGQNLLLPSTIAGVWMYTQPPIKSKEVDHVEESFYAIPANGALLQGETVASMKIKL